MELVRLAKFTEVGQYDGARCIWYERKSRIYIASLTYEGDPTVWVSRVFRNTGAVSGVTNSFPLSELTRIQPLTLSGLGRDVSGDGDPPTRLTDKAIPFVE